MKAVSENRQTLRPPLPTEQIYHKYLPRSQPHPAEASLYIRSLPPKCVPDLLSYCNDKDVFRYADPINV